MLILQECGKVPCTGLGAWHNAVGTAEIWHMAPSASLMHRNIGKSSDLSSPVFRCTAALTLSSKQPAASIPHRIKKEKNDRGMGKGRVRVGR